MTESGGRPLFLYGTLRTGGAAASMMVGCRHIRSAVIMGTMYDFGSYPAVVLRGAGKVYGELWMCPDETVEALDTYEGVQEGLFRRVVVEIGKEDCWIYVAGPRLEPLLSKERVVGSGRWHEEGSK